jgi:hypothetical protein
MSVTLYRDDYESISDVVRKKLSELMPENEFGTRSDLIFGPEFMAEPLRISTPSTRFEFDPVHNNYIKNLRKEIRGSEFSQEEKQQKAQQLESILLFGQILFSQAASLHFLKNAQHKSDEEISPIEKKMEHLRNLVQKEGIQYDSSRFEALSRRKEFNHHMQDLKKNIKNATMAPQEKHQLLGNLSAAKDFYYQANDFNFRYASQPSRSFSNFVKNCEYYGSKIALGASLIAIGASALSLIPPLAPVMAPIALVATAISLGVGFPLALKNVGTMLYNLIRFGAAPTPGELVNAALLGTSLLLAGVGGAVGQAVTAGHLGQSSQFITTGVNSADNFTKAAAGVAGQIKGIKMQNKVDLYKSELMRLKHHDQTSTLDDTDHTELTGQEAINEELTPHGHSSDDEGYLADDETVPEYHSEEEDSSEDEDSSFGFSH